MKIVVCVKRDLEGNLNLNYLLKKIRGHEVSVILSDKVWKKEREVKESSDFVFYERDLVVDFLFPLMERASLPEDSFNEGNLTFSQIEQAYEVPIRLIKDINSDEGVRYLQELSPDLILSVRYDLIFKKQVIDIPKLGIMNIHPGALPMYRGIMATFRAMMAGENRVGCTLHFVDEGIDTGSVIGVRYLDIDYGKSFLWHVVRLYPLGIDLFAEILPRLENGDIIPSQSQEGADFQYHTYPTTEEFHSFASKGYKLIDNCEYLDILDGYASLRALKLAWSSLPLALGHT